MITVSKVVEGIVANTPFVEEGLRMGLINVSALARKLKPEIEAKLMKPLKEGAIIMALNRMNLNPITQSKNETEKLIGEMGDIVVRSNLNVYTFANSETLTQSHTDLFDVLNNHRDVFFTFSQGVYERTIIISALIMDAFEKIFKNERLLKKKIDHASVTMVFPEDNQAISGVYYHILKLFAWENISISEVISTSNEFTLIVGNQFIDQAFSIFMRLKKEADRKV